MSKTWKDNDRKHNEFENDYAYRKFTKKSKKAARQIRNKRADRDRMLEDCWMAY